ncbi:MAG: ATP-binding protein [Chitinophagaceae bacterium]
MLYNRLLHPIIAKTEITYLIFFGTIVFFVLLFFVVGTLLIFYRRNRDYRDNLLEIEHKKEQEVLKAQLEIKEQTLKNISQEIHDNIGQVLSLVKLNINTMNLEETDKLKEKILTAKLLITKAIHDLRSLSKILDSDYIIEKGLFQSIEYELQLVNKAGSYKTELLTDGVPYRLNHNRELILFRIFQEVINNIIKHAGATIIRAELAYKADGFTLKISDNGQGFDLTPLHKNDNFDFGLGIRSMQKRANLIGADFNIQSSIGGGTQVNVVLPM